MNSKSRTAIKGFSVPTKNLDSRQNDYKVATEELPLDSKLEILDRIGRSDLVDLFKNWKPRVSKAKKRGAPLDQRVSITVTDEERKGLDRDLSNLRRLGEKISMSQFIRNRALGNIDINEWRDIVEKEIIEIQNIKKNENNLKKEVLVCKSDLEKYEDDEDESILIQERLNEIEESLNKIVAQSLKRKNRLSGRMSMAESETVKWRAQRLTVSTSDFLRMMIFNLKPGETADAHMSFEAKLRFYISIIDVAQNGWGEAPKIYNCSQCENYMDEILKLKERIKLLETFN